MTKYKITPQVNRHTGETVFALLQGRTFFGHLFWELVCRTGTADEARRVAMHLETPDQIVHQSE